MRNQTLTGYSAPHHSHKTYNGKSQSNHYILIGALEAIGFVFLMSSLVGVYSIADILDSILVGVR